MEDWEGFDIFRVAQLTEGRPLQTVGLNLLRKRGLIAKLRLPEDKLRSFLQASIPVEPRSAALCAGGREGGLGVQRVAFRCEGRAAADVGQSVVV